MKFVSKLMKPAVVLTAALLSTSAWAEYPTKPVTIVSPYGPGGAADLAARTLAATAPSYLGQSVLVVNRTGAAGVTGSTFVAKGRPDGYNLLLARVGSQAAVPAINPGIPYKWDEFTFLGLLEQNPFALVVPADSPYQSLDDIKAAIESGKKLSYSSAGVGTLLHLAMVVLMDELGVDQSSMKHVPYKGGGKAAAAVVGGHVDMMFQNLSGVLGNIQGGKMRAIAVSTETRPPSIPNVPTVHELGYPNLGVIVGWSGLWGPKNMPAEATDKWVGVLGQIKDDKAWNKMTKGLGSIPTVRNPADTKAFVKTQYETFKEVVERLGLTIK